MPTKEEYLAQGKTGQQIQDAIVAKNTAIMGEKLGQNLEAKSFPIANNVEQPKQEELNPQPSTVLPQPVPTPQEVVTPVTPEPPVKTQINEKQGTGAPDGTNYDSSVGREEQINANLSAISQQTPTLLSDRNAYNNAFGYNTADTGKKAILDSFFYNGQRNKEATSILNKYSSYSPTQFSEALKTTLLPGSKEWTTLMADPAMKQKIDKAQTLNQIAGRASIDGQAVSNATVDDIVNNNPTLASLLSDNQLTAEEKARLTTTPEITRGKAELEAMAMDINKKQSVYDNIENETKQQYSGSGLTASDIAQIVSNKQRDILPSLKLSIDNYNTKLGFVNDLVKSSEDLFTSNLALYKEQKAKEEAIATEKRQQTNALALDQAKFEQQIKQQAALASDPYTAISTVMDEYKKLGIPFDQGISTKVANANAFIKAGGTIGGYVDKMIKDVQAKPEWKALQNAKINEQYKPFSVGKDSVVFDPNTNSYIYQQGGGAKTTSPTSVAISVTSGTTRNRPDRNNNPGNVKIGDVGYGVDDQNHTIFGDAQTGYAAMVKDITAKLTGGSSQKSRLTGKILSPSSTLADLGSVYAEDPKWAQSVARLSGYPTNTQLSQIDVNVLAPAIAKQEGFTGIISAKQEEGPLDAGSGTPLVYAQRIKNLIPPTLKNSDLEGKNLNNTIKSLYEQGISPEDAILQYQGVQFKPDVKELGLNVFGVLRGTNAQPAMYSSIADKLNKGNTSGAIQDLENAVFKDKDINIADITSIGTNVKSGNKLIERINTLKDKFGPIAGKTEQWGQYLQDDKETQRLLSDMDNFVAKYRNGIAGTSVTSSETEFLKNIIPTLTNNPENAIAKIESNIGQSFNGLNTIRDQVGLPILQDPRSAYDINFRKQAFTGRGATTEPVTTTQTNKYNLDYDALAKILTQ